MIYSLVKLHAMLAYTAICAMAETVPDGLTVLPFMVFGCLFPTKIIALFPFAVNDFLL